MAGTALVLGGGGYTAQAWQAGVLAGLAGAGVDLTTADLVLGTSAGAVLGTRLASGEPPDRLYGRELEGGRDGLDLRISLAATARFLWAVHGTRDPGRARRRLGRLARSVRTGVGEDEVLTAVASLTGVREWPGRALRVAAVDVSTGAVGTFDAGGGVDLPRAVAASCAVPGIWPPIAADGRRWMDGGVRSTTNADLVRGYGRVVVLAPLPRPVGPGPGAADHVAELAAGGTEAVLLTPDRASRRAFGRNPLDHARRPAAARAGHAQAAAAAGAVAAVWHG
ncbi:patatin-like phospholipase family protein [Streptacidiphilus sp. ASG 303]|uniref:patatin-like phospholipase family protein n=1 Tax=Streptacidiphilus sp. ASG 303 TaxID=2896847 RepID=UPI001E4903D0|nr:patatin-like phospholipase family protein [Streptacidiphilus sp. ASG 303]MCD0484246.1 patatin-like phospholipase family protein [Streptacidiphilus sp. ASG 303]